MITDPFFRRLANRIAEEIGARTELLVTGSAISRAQDGRIDAHSTAMKYSYECGYISALQAIAEYGSDIDKDMYGRQGKSDA